MTQTLTIGLSANDGGPHTPELLRAFVDAREWLGCTVDFVWMNDGREPVRARKAAAHLSSCGVSIVVGHLSAAAAVAAAEIYAASDTVFIAPATSHPQINPGGWEGILRAFGTDERTARTMLAACLPGATPVVIEQRQAYGAALADALSFVIKDFGSAPVRIAPYFPPEAVSLPHDTSTLYVCGIHEFCIDVIRAVRGNGFIGAVAVGDDCFTPNFLASGGADVDGCFVATQIVPGSANGKAGTLVRGEAIEGYYPTCLIATTVALQAATRFPDLSGAALGRAIRAQDWLTPFGWIGFDRNGDLRGLRDALFRVEGNCLVAQPMLNFVCQTDGAGMGASS